MSTVEGGGNIITDGLVMCLDAANTKSYIGSGSTVWNDMSQRGLVGTLTNSPTFSNTKVGSIVFDGVDDYVEIPTSPIVNDSYNNWTIDVWMRPGAQTSRFISPNSGGLFQFITYDTVNQRIILNIAETNLGANIRLRTTPVRSMLVNNWNMLTISINNLSIKFYVNGILTNTYTETINIASWEGAWRLGQRYNNTFWYLGEMAMVKTYSRELSSSEVLQNYNATKTRFGL